MQFPSYRRFLLAGATAAAAVALFAIPASASAQTLSDDTAALSNLQSQVDSLQNQVDVLHQLANEAEGRRTGIYRLDGPHPLGPTLIGNGVSHVGDPGLTVIS